MKKISIIALCFLLIDQSIKILVNNIFSFGQSLAIIPSFFSITLLKNTGAAFSILRSSTLFLILISVVALILIYLFFIKNKGLTNTDKWLYGMLIGGVLGNLFDRIFYGYVIDYLDFNIFNFPVFNFADVLIVISIILIIINMIRREEHGV